MSNPNPIPAPSINDPLVAAAPASANPTSANPTSANPDAPATPQIPSTPEEIEDFIRQSRLDMGDTVDELVERLHPKNQAKAVKAKAQGLVEDLKQTAVQAKDGDAEARKKVGIAAGVVVGLVLLRALRRRK